MFKLYWKIGSLSKKMDFGKEEIIFEITKKKGFLSFCKKYLFQTFSTPYIEEDYYKDWDEMLNSRDPYNKLNRILIRWLEEISRGHSKTAFLTIFSNIYDAVTQPGISLALGSALNTQTKAIADKLKETLLKSPYLRYKFVPDQISRLDEKSAASASNTQWNNDKITLKNGSTIIFRSMQQEWSGLHVQKITLDDPTAKKQSKLSDEECIRTLQYDIIPTAKRLKADLFIVGTPVRKNDVLAHVKKLGLFQIHHKPAISDFERFKKLTTTIFLQNGIPLSDFQEQAKWVMNNQDFIFSKALITQEVITKLCLSKNSFGWKGYLQTFAEVQRNAFFREYLLQIKHSSKSIIGHPFLEQAKKNGMTHGFVTKREDWMTKAFLIWDFSFSKSDKADYTSCVLAFTDKRFPGKNYYQLLWNVQPKDYPNWKTTLIHKIKSFWKQYEADAVIPEANSILQLTDDFQSLGVPLKPIWTGSSDITSKAKINKKNFGNMISIDKTAAIERLGTEFENNRVALVSGVGAKESADTLIDELESWEYEDETEKIIEGGAHPNAGLCVVLGNEFFRQKGGVKTIGGFLR
jgi:hypothetical protein